MLAPPSIGGTAVVLAPSREPVETRAPIAGMRMALDVSVALKLTQQVVCAGRS